MHYRLKHLTETELDTDRADRKPASDLLQAINEIKASEGRMNRLLTLAARQGPGSPPPGEAPKPFGKSRTTCAPQINAAKKFQAPPLIISRDIKQLTTDIEQSLRRLCFAILFAAMLAMIGLSLIHI